MNKKRILFCSGLTLSFLAGSAAAVYLYAFVTLKQQAQSWGKTEGFKLYVDGVVIDHLQPDPAIDLKQVYLHGLPWQLLWEKPEYVSIAEAGVQADNLLGKPIVWPFAGRPLEITTLKIEKTILQNKVILTGSAKQTPETPLLVDFANDDENQPVSGKAELRFDHGKIQMVDMNFDQLDLTSGLFGAKRATGWLSFSYESDWQVVGEMDAGIALIGPYQFFDSTLKFTGPVIQPEMTFAGQLEQKQTIIDRREDNYYLRQDDKTIPVVQSEQPLQEIVAALDKLKQIQVAEAEALKAEQEKQAAEEEKKLVKAKKKEAKQAEVAKVEVKPEIPVTRIEPIKLPEIALSEITGNTSLAGFIYSQKLVQVSQPCPPNITGSCWVAHGQGGSFTYNPNVLPKYFLQLKDYEQVKQLKEALLNFNVQSMTVQGKDKSARYMTLKGTTATSQPAEIQLEVLGLE